MTMTNRRLGAALLLLLSSIGTRCVAAFLLSGSPNRRMAVYTKVPQLPVGGPPTRKSKIAMVSNVAIDSNNVRVNAGELKALLDEALLLDRLWTGGSDTAYALALKELIQDITHALKIGGLEKVETKTVGLLKESRKIQLARELERVLERYMKGEITEEHMEQAASDYRSLPSEQPAPQPASMEEPSTVATGLVPSTPSPTLLESFKARLQALKQHQPKALPNRESLPWEQSSSLPNKKELPRLQFSNNKKPDPTAVQHLLDQATLLLVSPTCFDKREVKDLIEEISHILFYARQREDIVPLFNADRENLVDQPPISNGLRPAAEIARELEAALELHLTMADKLSKEILDELALEYKLATEKTAIITKTVSTLSTVEDKAPTQDPGIVEVSAQMIMESLQERLTALQKGERPAANGRRSSIWEAVAHGFTEHTENGFRVKPPPGGGNEEAPRTEQRKRNGRKSKFDASGGAAATRELEEESSSSSGTSFTTNTTVEEDDDVFIDAVILESDTIEIAVGPEDVVVGEPPRRPAASNTPHQQHGNAKKDHAIDASILPDTALTIPFFNRFWNSKRNVAAKPVEVEPAVIADAAVDSVDMEEKINPGMRNNEEDKRTEACKRKQEETNRALMETRFFLETHAKEYKAKLHREVSQRALLTDRLLQDRYKVAAILHATVDSFTNIPVAGISPIGDGLGWSNEAPEEIEASSTADTMEALMEETVLVEAAAMQANMDIVPEGKNPQGPETEVTKRTSPADSIFMVASTHAVTEFKDELSADMEEQEATAEALETEPIVLELEGAQLEDAIGSQAVNIFDDDASIEEIVEANKITDEIILTLEIAAADTLEWKHSNLSSDRALDLEQSEAFLADFLPSEAVDGDKPGPTVANSEIDMLVQEALDQAEAALLLASEAPKTSSRKEVNDRRAKLVHKMAGMAFDMTIKGVLGLGSRLFDPPIGQQQAPAEMPVPPKYPPATSKPEPPSPPFFARVVKSGLSDGGMQADAPRRKQGSISPTAAKKSLSEKRRQRQQQARSKSFQQKRLPLEEYSTDDLWLQKTVPTASAANNNTLMMSATQLFSRVPKFYEEGAEKPPEATPVPEAGLGAKKLNISAEVTATNAPTTKPPSDPASDAQSSESKKEAELKSRSLLETRLVMEKKLSEKVQQREAQLTAQRLLSAPETTTATPKTEAIPNNMTPSTSAKEKIVAINSDRPIVGVQPDAFGASSNDSDRGTKLVNPIDKILQASNKVSPGIELGSAGMQSSAASAASPVGGRSPDSHQLPGDQRHDATPPVNSDFSHAPIMNDDKQIPAKPLNENYSPVNTGENAKGEVGVLRSSQINEDSRDVKSPLKDIYREPIANKELKPGEKASSVVGLSGNSVDNKDTVSPLKEIYQNIETGEKLKAPVFEISPNLIELSEDNQDLRAPLSDIYKIPNTGESAKGVVGLSPDSVKFSEDKQDIKSPLKEIYQKIDAGENAKLDAIGQSPNSTEMNQDRQDITSPLTDIYREAIAGKDVTVKTDNQDLASPLKEIYQEAISGQKSASPAVELTGDVRDVSSPLKDIYGHAETREPSNKQAAPIAGIIPDSFGSSAVDSIDVKSPLQDIYRKPVQSRSRPDDNLNLDSGKVLYSRSLADNNDVKAPLQDIYRKPARERPRTGGYISPVTSYGGNADSMDVKSPLQEIYRTPKMERTGSNAPVSGEAATANMTVSEVKEKDDNNDPPKPSGGSSMNHPVNFFDVRRAWVKGSNSLSVVFHSLFRLAVRVNVILRKIWKTNLPRLQAALRKPIRDSRSKSDDDTFRRRKMATGTVLHAHAHSLDLEQQQQVAAEKRTP